MECGIWIGENTGFYGMKLEFQHNTGVYFDHGGRCFFFKKWMESLENGYIKNG
jgi:hypothetical protein